MRTPSGNDRLAFRVCRGSRLGQSWLGKMPRRGRGIKRIKLTVGEIIGRRSKDLRWELGLRDMGWMRWRGRYGVFSRAGRFHTSRPRVPTVFHMWSLLIQSVRIALFWRGEAVRTLWSTFLVHAPIPRVISCLFVHFRGVAWWTSNRCLRLCLAIR